MGAGAEIEFDRGQAIAPARGRTGTGPDRQEDLRVLYGYQQGDFGFPAARDSLGPVHVTCLIPSRVRLR